MWNPCTLLCMFVPLPMHKHDKCHTTCLMMNTSHHQSCVLVQIQNHSPTPNSSLRGPTNNGSFKTSLHVSTKALPGLIVSDNSSSVGRHDSGLLVGHYLTTAPGRASDTAGSQGDLSTGKGSFHPCCALLKSFNSRTSCFLCTDL